MTFIDKIKKKWDEGKFVCIGLDEGTFDFSKKIIDQTSDIVCAYKPNTAFYEAHGAEGWKDLEKTCQYLRENYPEITIIVDAKRADIGNTNSLYAKAFFEIMNADALTINPYPGKEALMPFLEYKDKGIVIWLGASNPGTGKIQDFLVNGEELPLYQVVAKDIAQNWNFNGNCAVVVGATYPEELKKVREIVGDMPILVPGIGAQGGDLEATIKYGLDSKKQGLIISSSRGIIFSENPRQATLNLHQQIKEFI